MKLGELLFEVLFKAETFKLNDFIKGIGELNMKTLLGAGNLKLFWEMGEKAVGIADELALGLNKFSRETGMSTKELQQFTHAAEEMGMSPESVEQSVRRLQQSVFMLKKTGEGSNIWAMLGIDPTKAGSMFELLGQMREKFKGLSIETQQWFANSLLGSTEMLNLFSLSDEEFKKIGHHQYLSNKQLEKMTEFHKSIASLGHTAKLVWADIGVMLSPVVSKISDIAASMEKATRESQKWKGTLDVVSEILVRIVDGWEKIIKWNDMISRQDDSTIMKALGKGMAWGNPLSLVGSLIKGASTQLTQRIHAPIYVTTNDPDSFAKSLKKKLGEMSRDIQATLKGPDQ